jgi:M6 family metalloprotease-like protein
VGTWLPGLSPNNLRAATLADFGFNHMTIGGHEARGHRPLLVVLVNFDTGPAFAHEPAYYDDLVFNFFNTNSLNGYVLENSNSRFFWERAGRRGMIGPLNRPATERFTNWQAQAVAKGLIAKDVHWGEYLWFSNIVARAMLEGATDGTNSFDFPAYDVNHDNVLTADELSLLIISNDVDGTKDGEGLYRSTTRVQPAGALVAVDQGATAFMHRASFNVMAHESCHLLGTLDLYGAAGLSADLSLMGGTTDRARIYHLDPWHKMALSWSEPRVGSLRAGGKAVVAAAQLTQANAPVILYDPLGDPNEYFMLEYRTPTSPVGSGFDRNVAGSGLVIWHVRQDTGKNPERVTDLALGPLPGQPNWRWCEKCQGLVYGGSQGPGPCAEGGTHVTAGSLPYQLVFQSDGPGQHDWRWCNKCQGLFFGGGVSVSACPVGGRHDPTGSFDYSLVIDAPDTAGQTGWRWCRKCQSLFYGPNQPDSNCAADGSIHDGSASGLYNVVTTTSGVAVFTEGAPDLQHGGNHVWAGGVTTPNLRWLDGTAMPVRIYVHPFAPGDGSITVEWLREETVWVEFGYTGLERGTFENPYHLFGEGVGAVPHGGTVRVKRGNNRETVSISKRVRVEAYDGPVTIGR